MAAQDEFISENMIKRREARLIKSGLWVAFIFGIFLLVLLLFFLLLGHLVMGLVGERVALMARKSLIIGRQIKDIRSVVVDDDEEEGGGGGGGGRGVIAVQPSWRRIREQCSSPTLSARFPLAATKASSLTPENIHNSPVAPPWRTASPFPPPPNFPVENNADKNAGFGFISSICNWFRLLAFSFFLI